MPTAAEQARLGGLSSTKNVWDYAAIKVENKGVLSRIGHSSRLHGLRSAFNSPGSFASKALSGLGAVARASLSLVPIPVIGSLAAQAEQALESKFRSWRHDVKAKRGKASSSVEKEIKFALKEASLADMDRYRFKVTQSHDDLKKAMDTWNNTGHAAAQNGSGGNKCAHQAALAYAVAQAERRLDIFDAKVAEIKALLVACEQWTGVVRASVVGLKNGASTQFAAIAQAEQNLLPRLVAGQPPQVPAMTQAAATELMMSTHADCGEFCIHSDNKVNTSWDKFRSGGATVVRELQAPFSAESFLSLNRASFEGAKQTDNYLEKSQRSS
ncbi:MAG: hypothetical protein V4505_05485 [Pseudomonadota bacterium]